MTDADKAEIAAMIAASKSAPNWLSQNTSVIATVLLAIFAWQSGLLDRDGSQNVGLARLETTMSGLEQTIERFSRRMTDIEAFTREPRFTRQDYIRENAGVVQQVERNSNRLELRSTFMAETNARLDRLEVTQKP